MLEGNGASTWPPQLRTACTNPAEMIPPSTSRSMLQEIKGSKADKRMLIWHHRKRNDPYESEEQNGKQCNTIGESYPEYLAGCVHVTFLQGSSASRDGMERDDKCFSFREYKWIEELILSY